MRINLLPPEIFERQRTRRRTIAVGAAGFILLAGLGAFFVLQVLRLSEVEADIEAQRGVNAGLQTQIGELQEVAQLEQQVTATRTLLDGLLADRVQWSRVLGDVSLVIPSEAWLNGLTGSVGDPSAVEGQTTPAAAAGIVGQIQFTGFAFEHRDVALWLSRLEDVRGFVNPWLSSSTKVKIGDTEVVQFNTSVDLTEETLDRGGNRP